MTAPGDFYITRHEIGHNLGHPHHGANIYDWRLNEITYDGFDLVSGGGYNTSDFAAASKWHYNWITNDAIVLMQPEGPTQACPTCQAAVSRLVLKSFDKSSVIPSASNPVAIHIPLVGNSDKGMFSYWLSYRGVSNDGRARKGLSLHLTKLYSLGGPAAAHYDSVNFDAIGDTVDTIDSFILPSTCYVATAPVMLLLQGDNVEAPKVQPVICVDDIVPGSSITVSVSFLDPLAPPTPQASLASHQKFGCLPENGSRLDVSKSKVHLLSFQGTGTQGTINFSFCRESGTESVTAYFYDSYVCVYGLCFWREKNLFWQLSRIECPVFHMRCICLLFQLSALDIVVRLIAVVRCFEESQNYRSLFHSRVFSELLECRPNPCASRVVVVVDVNVWQCTMEVQLRHFHLFCQSICKRSRDLYSQNGCEPSYSVRTSTRPCGRTGSPLTCANSNIVRIVAVAKISQRLQ